MSKMAVSKAAISQFQDVIRCSICDDEVGQLHCDTCQVYICKSCTGTHVTSDLSKQHLVVECNKRSKIKLTECQTHASQRCDLYCRQCDISVCSKCMASAHKQHDVIDILEFCKSIQEKIREENRKIEESKILLLEKSKLEINAQIKDLPKHYEKIIKEIKEYGEMWHRKIDAIIKEFNEEVENMKKTDLNRMINHQRQLDELVSFCRQILQDNTKVLQSGNMSSFDKYKSRIQDIKDIPLTIVFQPPEFQSAKFDMEAIHTWFGLLRPSILELKSTTKRRTKIIVIPNSPRPPPPPPPPSPPPPHTCKWLARRREIKEGACFICRKFFNDCVECGCIYCGKSALVCCSCRNRYLHQ